MHGTHGTRRGTALAVRLGGALAALGLSGWVVAGTTTSAFADSQPYELYCPGTPVGTIALNDVVTTASLSPASPASGSQFNVTNWQSKVTIPATIANAAVALGNSSLTGSATAKLDATGATPATLSAPSQSFNQPFPSPIPSTGVQLILPATAGTLGPFTASGGPITIAEDSSTSLTLVVSGNNLNLTCTAYANDSVPSGITQTKPSGSPLSPTIATSSSPGTSPPTTAAPTTTVAPSTSSSGGLANTGPGPDLYLLGELGVAGLVAAGLLTTGHRLRLRQAPAGRGRASHGT